MAKRRANGEGSIRKRSDGRWEGRYTVGTNENTGKRIVKSVLGKTQAEVLTKLKTAIENAKGLDANKTDQYTVYMWLEIWFENYAKVKVRESSHKTYQGYIKNHIKPKIGNIKLNKLKTLDLQKFYKYLLESGRVDRIESKNKPKGLSAKTVRNIHQIISTSLEIAKAEKLIISNPAEYCSLPRLQHIEMNTLSADDLERFFTEAKASGVYEMYYIELSTGLRRGELLGLKWKDINFKTGIISVKRQVLRINGEIVESQLKTKNSYRNIVIGDYALKLLKEHKKSTASEYVFPSDTGGPISPDSVLNMLHRVLKRAGLPKVRFHDLRHTFATIALQNGVDIKTLSSMLGHFSAGFTLDTYTHVTTESQISAANTLNDVLQASKSDMA